MNNSIKLENISFSYGSEKNVITNFSYEFYKGRVYSIVGKNGSSKTTLANLIANLYLPNSGIINYFDDVIISSRKRDKKLFNKINKKISILFQFSENQLLGPTVIDDVKYGLLNNNVSDVEAEKIASNFLSYFSFPNSLFNSSIFDLSQGQKRKVALSSIFCMDKDVIILDEPTIAIDYETKQKLTSLIKDYKQKNKLIIIISHDFDWIYEFVDEVLLMQDGKLIFSDNYNVFFRNNIILDTFNTRPFIEEIISKLKQKDSKYEFLDKINFRTLDDLISKIKEI